MDLLTNDAARLPTLSVVVPVFNEEEVLPEFHRRLSAVLDGLGEDVEIVYVNDGSQDRSTTLLAGLHASDPRVVVVDLSRNFGKEAAMSAGLDHADGDAVIVIDADLQDPPELVPEMLREWRAGYDVVLMRRRSRARESWLKQGTARAFYYAIGRIGTIMGGHDINIASMNLGRREKKGEAMVILSLDSAVPPEVVEEVRQATDASFIKAVHMPGMA